MRSAQQFTKNELRELPIKRPQSRVYEQREQKAFTQKEIKQIKDTLSLPVSLRQKIQPTEKGISRYQQNISWNFQNKLDELRKLGSSF